MLEHMTPAIERHAGKSGVIYRLIVGNFKSKAKAATRCKALKRKRIDCWARPSARNWNPGHSANDSPPLQAPKAKHSQQARGAGSQKSGRQDPDQAVAIAPPARLHYTKP